MTDMAIKTAETNERVSDTDTPARVRNLKQRRRAELRFQGYGILAVTVAGIFLVIMLGSIFIRGYSAFWTYEVQMPIFFDPAVIDPDGTRDPTDLRRANYAALIRDSLYDTFPDVTSRGDRRTLGSLISRGAAAELQNMVTADPGLIGTRQTVSVPVASDVAMILKGQIDRTLPESDRTITDQQLGWIDQLDAAGNIDAVLNTRFLSTGDSREPELAGVWGAVVGSFYALLVCFLISFPIAVMAAVYLEEFAPHNRWTDLIEVNINNLAAVPSIVFGLLGLAVFLNFFTMPRSAPLVGGMTLALMTLPTIIIASRAALKAVPPSIREAARGLGASDTQTTGHHVLPLAMPGILTGTIIGMAQALGETAPLLMIGMVAFVVDIPGSPTDAATALPVQVYLWADSPERGFVEKTSAAALILVFFLVLMNALAVMLRKRFERRW
ncbi:MAG: phosphate ABC transporter permease PstA [Alphaproteobacteria bacterium]